MRGRRLVRMKKERKTNGTIIVLKSNTNKNIKYQIGKENWERKRKERIK